MSRRLVRRTLAAAAIVFAACTGDTIYLTLNFDPEVVSTVPLDGATNVDLAGTVSVTFSEVVDTSSIDSATLRLERDGISVPATYAIAGSTASLVLTDELDWLTTYSAVATTGIVDVSGKPLESSASWQFATRDLGWTVPTMVSSSAAATHAYFLDARVHRDGEIWVLYRQQSAGAYDLYVQRFSFRDGWGPRTSIENRSETVNDASLAMDGAGNVFAVWTQSDGTANSVWANRWNGSLWGGPTLVENENGLASSSRVVADSAGNAIAVWTQEKDGGGPPLDAWAGRYDRGTGWEAPQLLESDDTGSVGLISIGGSLAGKAIAVWSQPDATTMNLFAAHYVPGVGWSARESVEDSTVSVSGEVYVDREGRAFACWQESLEIWCNRFDGSLWNGPQRLVQDAYQPAVGISPSGKTALLSFSSGMPKIGRVRLFDPLTGWGTPAVIDSRQFQVYNTNVRINDRGDVIATYTYEDALPDYNAFATRLVPGRGWSPPAALEGLSTAVFNVPIALRSDGRALGLWSQQFDGSDRLWSATLR